MGHYRAVVIGAGLAGSEMPQSHIEGYLEHPRTRLVGVIDPSLACLQAARRKHALNCAFGQDVSFIGALHPEIVSIATPEDTHLEVFRRVLRAYTPAAIFMEKPLATTRVAALEIAQTSEDLHIVLAVNHARAWDLDYRRMTPPRKIRYAGPDWRNDVHAFHLAKMLGVDKVEKTEGRGLWLDESVAYGALRRNTMAKAISDLIQGIEDGKRPECGAREAIQAVLETIAAHEGTSP